MLRPYLAIIKDSFRAAIANRLLIVLALIITLFLLALAPLNFNESIESGILYNPGARSGNHVPRPDGLALYLVENQDNPAVARLASYLDEKDLKKIKKDLDAGKDQLHEQIERGDTIIRAFRSAIEDENLYDPKIWDLSKSVNQELAEFHKRGIDNLSYEEKKRLNRLLISNSFPGLILPPAQSLVTVKYLHKKLFESHSGIELYRSQVTSYLPYLMDKFVLSIGLLIAVLVTAPLMPTMFDVGSLSLLLSKPISRWGLYLAKFIGGCAFVALLATYLFIGVWFLLGFRLGLWDRSILLSIPIYVIVFAIYFSVSAFVGMYFRNTIIAAIVTFLFWAVCFTGGTIFKMFDGVNEKTKIAHFVEANGQTIQLNNIDAPAIWDKNTKQWVESFADNLEMQNHHTNYSFSFFPFIPESGLPTTDCGLKPTYCPKYQFVIGGSNLIFADQASFSRPRIFYSSVKEDNYQPQVLGYMSGSGIKFLVHPDGDLILVTGFGKFRRLAGDPEDFIGHKDSKKDDPKSKQDEEKKSEEDDSPGSDRRRNRKATQLVDFKELFKPVGPDKPTSISNYRMVDLNKQTGEIAVYHRKKISIYREDAKGNYVLDRTVDLDVSFDSTMTAWIQFQGQQLYLAFGNGEINVFDGGSLKLQQSYIPENKSAIKHVHASPNGRFLAVNYRNGNTWLLDANDLSDIRKRKFVGQGNTSYAAFDKNNKIWVADRTDRITQYDPETLQQAGEYNPKIVGFRWYYWWIRLGYRILPKPGEFYKLVTHLSSSTETEKDSNLDLTQTDEPSNPWEPFVSGVIFMSIMLLLACFVFQRTDY